MQHQAFVVLQGQEAKLEGIHDWEQKKKKHFAESFVYFRLYGFFLLKIPRGGIGFILYTD